ncbi:hypothetical protein GLOIN_2v1672403 [Rhizophagus irregularis DAOM 181602=DAOM 197198]|uniref:Uncharacterized protein n=1 Tax=Rhizophagus irregularis (strain DAOM 181602 / DAOM 197198 / MUCL 43194) TaxID=747089 RepID=A0A2P4PH70_RHIID|nr:hypothetical protein GLOIN_2v1672403 [Rhizophagus irregularis DAOM 181602=DAOM 197198]POG64739.1 hypothetical protein GLOIN_2v1672403 [Rhizophagus irregularis DAOM 181602=DAOM 197198]|eukprot:XP_025171605.1 hypothetical protein GLOIN_2v1672403 [Rhizophagus irregularis DAOM 181602=DAOM 197198]
MVWNNYSTFTHLNRFNTIYKWKNSLDISCNFYCTRVGTYTYHYLYENTWLEIYFCVCSNYYHIYFTSHNIFYILYLYA